MPSNPEIPRRTWMQAMASLLFWRPSTKPVEPECDCSTLTTPSNITVDFSTPAESHQCDSLNLGEWHFDIPAGCTVFGISWGAFPEVPAAYVERGCGECAYIAGRRISDATNQS